MRKREFDGYRKGLTPPDRFMTTGACSLYFLYPQVLNDLDMLRDLEVILIVIIITHVHVASYY